MRKYILMSVPTGTALLGRVVDPLGNPLDDLGNINSKGSRFIEQIAPSIFHLTHRHISMFPTIVLLSQQSPPIK